MRRHQWQTPKKKQYEDEIIKKFSKTQKRQADLSLENYAVTNKKYEEIDQHPELIGYHPLIFKNQEKSARDILKQSMAESQYSEASRQIKRINRIKQKEKKQRLRVVSAEHHHQKKLIEKAHEEEMIGFKRAWNEVFYRFKIYEREKKEELNRAEAIDQEYCRCEIIRRCRSAKPSTKLAQIRDLEHLERGLRKRGQTKQLRVISSQKRKLKTECQKQFQKAYSRIISQQQSKYKERQTKRYHSFMQRIRQSKKDQEKMYKREQQRLKQKFKNILKNLQHDQAMELNNVRVGIFL